jgi:hypothetical protein
MKICQNCKKEIVEDSEIFCPFCGHELKQNISIKSYIEKKNIRIYWLLNIGTILLFFFPIYGLGLFVFELISLIKVWKKLYKTENEEYFIYRNIRNSYLFLNITTLLLSILLTIIFIGGLSNL